MRDFFVFDGIDSQDLGITLQAPISFSGSTPKFSTIKIPGRNGDLHFFENAYENDTGTATCFLLTKNVDAALDQMKKWTFQDFSYKRLEVSNEPEVYRKAKLTSPIGTEIRVGLLAPFEILFNCMPGKYLKSGENIIEITKPGSIYNSWMKSLPEIKIYGSGQVNISINGISISISEINDYIILDCDTQNAYKETENLNNKISAPIFPYFDSGENKINWSGSVSKIEIIPKWWTL